MAEMGVAPSAEDLDADHAVAAVGGRDHVLGSHGLEEAGPAGPESNLPLDSNSGNPKHTHE